MEPKPQEHGLVQIRDGKVTKLEHVTDPASAIVGNGDPLEVLNRLAEAGWKVYGDYTLKIYKNQ